MVVGFIFVMVIDTEQSPRESQNLAEGDKDGIMNFAGRRHDEAGNQEAAAYHYQQNCG